MQHFLYEDLLIDMKLSIRWLIVIIVMTSLSDIQGQFYKRISTEFGFNRSKVLNTADGFSQSLGNINDRNRMASNTERPSYSNNYSMSIGYRFFKNHQIRIRHSANSLGSYITGDYGCYDFCNIGAGRFLDNAYNRFTNKTLGLFYEFNLPISGGAISLGLGYEKQWNNYEETFVVFPGTIIDNYAVHSSVGFLVPLFSTIKIHPKIFMTRSFENPNTFDLTWFTEKYIPIQVGFEIGVRFDFDEL